MMKKLKVVMVFSFDGDEYGTYQYRVELDVSEDNYNPDQLISYEVGSALKAGFFMFPDKGLVISSRLFRSASIRLID